MYFFFSNYSNCRGERVSGNVIWKLPALNDNTYQIFEDGVQLILNTHFKEFSTEV
jgi:hypothetical protein